MGGLALLNPAGAFLFAAVGILIALHLYERRHRTIPVASLLLWRQVPPHALERRRFRPDFLFALQLVLLLALIAGSLRPYLEADAAAVAGMPLVVVLDASASMQTREDGGTRFELARQRVGRALVDRTDADETMLLLAAERPHVALRWTRDRSDARRRLETLEPVDTPTNLAAALELAREQAAARAPARILVVTDLPPEASGIGADALAAADYVQIGRRDDNLAIASVAIARTPFGAATDSTATVVVRNYGSSARRTVVSARVNDQPWARRELVLGARTSEHLLLTRPPAAGVLAVTLAGGDALPVDDRALAWIPPDQPLDLLLVSDSRELAAAFREVAAVVAGSRVEVVDRARYADGPAEGSRVVLFDRFVPSAQPPDRNVLYVAPPPGNPVCPSTGVEEGTRVIDWEPDHPLLAGLDTLQAVTAGRTSLLLEPDWGRQIVRAASRSAAYPFLVTGERDGRRVACLAAELAAPLTSSDRLPLLVLTLGTLRWLGEPHVQQVATIVTGSPTLPGPGFSGPVDGPGLRIAGDPPVLLAERAGRYRIGAGPDARLVLATFVDDRESDVGRDGGGEWPATKHAPSPPQPAPREIGWWLYLTAALLLALEWGVWERRESGR